VVEELRRANALIEQQQIEDAKKRAALEDAERRRRAEIAAVERVQRELQEAERKGREQALGLLTRQAVNSNTGYECAIQPSGVIMRRPRGVTEQAEWSNVTARASYATFDRNVDGIPRQTALTIEIRGDDSNIERPRCVLVIASPAPLDPSPVQRQELKLGLDALSRLGVKIVAWEPTAVARRNVLLPKGLPANYYPSYGCVRNGMPGWCGGDNTCAVEMIPVVTSQCTLMEGVTRCRVQCRP
jgi:hypothetical protein